MVGVVCGFHWWWVDGGRLEVVDWWLGWFVGFNGDGLRVVGFDR